MVFAHSLGVPVSWIRLRYTILTPDDIKFYDYLSALNITGENLCNIIPIKDVSLKDLQNLKCIDVDKTVMKNKKHELLTCLVGVFRKFGYKIKPEFESY
ncbi:putative exoV-like protein [Megavirus courdo7]|nr:putative exoV-like protein [Megavirus courdo7]